MPEARSSSRLRVLVSDEQPIYRDGLIHAFEGRGYEVFADRGLSATMVGRVATVAPDVVVMGIQSATPQVLRVVGGLGHTAARVIVLCGRIDGATIYETLEAGAAGVLPKTAEAAAVRSAVDAAASGESVIPRALGGLLTAELRLRSSHNGVHLTPRETDILTRIARGQSARQVASELSLSVSTVKTHLAHTYDKLHVSAGAAAVAEAIRQGLLS
jgi:two-component system nitrate/nitrite response regulator NarL